MALSAYESGWLGPDAVAHQNLFGQDVANGTKMITFSSFQASADAWVGTVGPYVMLTSSYDIFIEGLQAKGYNTRNPAWASTMKRMLMSIWKWEAR
jgi:hypothetical protein